MGLPQGTESARPRYREWLRGVLIVIAGLVVLRFILEAFQAPPQTTALVSSSVGVFLGAIYLGAVAPLKGITKYRQLVVPALVVGAWFGAWNGLALILSAVFHLTGSHFASVPGFEHWQHLGWHMAAHFLGVALFTFPIVLGLMAFLYFLHRWPIIVAPSAVLGGLVALRFAAEALKLAPTTASAWSSSVGILLSALYLGGIGSRLGFVSARQLLLPALVLGWVWRFWIFLAALLSATPAVRTHFFDPSGGRVGLRLLEFFGLQVVVGFAAGLLAWGIATSTFRATRVVA